VTEGVAALERRQVELLDEPLGPARLLVDLDHLARAHDSQLRIALAQPAHGLGRFGVEHEDGVASVHLRFAPDRLPDGRPVLARVGAEQRHLRSSGRHGVAVERHAGGVRPAVAQLQQHVAEVTSERVAHVLRLGEEADYSAHVLHRV